MESAREALKNGLKLEQDLGTNPFKFGMVGGTDQHIGITAIEEENFFGITPMDEPKAERSQGVFSKLGDVKFTMLSEEMQTGASKVLMASCRPSEILWT